MVKNMKLDSIPIITITTSISTNVKLCLIVFIVLDIDKNHIYYLLPL
jgi:hypothetical protein